MAGESVGIERGALLDSGRFLIAVAGGSGNVPPQRPVGSCRPPLLPPHRDRGTTGKLATLDELWPGLPCLQRRQSRFDVRPFNQIALSRTELSGRRGYPSVDR